MLQPDEVSSCEPQGIACVDYFTFNFGLMPCLYPCSVQGWQATSKPAFEIHSLERSVKGNSVPMPKSVIRLILNSVLPRLLQRRLLRLLPQELGEYLLQAGKGFGLGGELSTAAGHSDTNCQAQASACAPAWGSHLLHVHSGTFACQ